MVRRVALVLAAALGLTLVASPGAALADTPAPSTGYDLSFPQCGTSLPARDQIAVVGVNDGLATTTNPCLADQLAWADSWGVPGDVYVNTADPGRLGGWWPGSDLTRVGLPVTNPYGACVGAEDAACAYVYGYSIAWDDVFTRGVPDAARRTWWLDVETTNTWSWDRGANRAVLEGMTDLLHQVGADVGLYSTTQQWNLIVGDAGPDSHLVSLRSWIAGAVTQDGAVANCATGGFTLGGSAWMAQWTDGSVDHDVHCAP